MSNDATQVIDMDKQLSNIVPKQLKAQHDGYRAYTECLALAQQAEGSAHELRNRLVSGNLDDVIYYLGELSTILPQLQQKIEGEKPSV